MLAQRGAIGAIRAARPEVRRSARDNRADQKNSNNQATKGGKR